MSDAENEYRTYVMSPEFQSARANPATRAQALAELEQRARSAWLGEQASSGAGDLAAGEQADHPQADEAAPSHLRWQGVPTQSGHRISAELQDRIRELAGVEGYHGEPLQRMLEIANSVELPETGEQGELAFKLARIGLTGGVRHSAPPMPAASANPSVRTASRGLRPTSRR